MFWNLIRSLPAALSARSSSPLHRRVQPSLEKLEDRALLSSNVSIQLADWGSILDSRVNVGFRRNPVAEVEVSVDNHSITDPSAIKAEVNYGDSRDWQPGELAPYTDKGNT